MARPAVFFDLDKTILARSSTLAYGPTFYRAGLVSLNSMLHGAFAQFVFAVAGADHDYMDRTKAQLQRVCVGWEVATIQQIIADTLDSLIVPLVFDEAIALIAEHKSRGHDIVIVSSSGSDVVRPIGTLLGADHVIATEMVVEEGRYTGEIARYVYGHGKVEVMHELADGNDYDLDESFGFSDSITDLPMLEALGHPTAVNPDRQLRQHAEQAGWPIVRFSSRTWRLGQENVSPPETV